MLNVHPAKSSTRKRESSSPIFLITDVEIDAKMCKGMPVLQKPIADWSVTSLILNGPLKAHSADLEK